MTDERCVICGRQGIWIPRGQVPDMVSLEMFTIVECSACGVLRTRPVPADLRPYYASEMGQMMKRSPSRLHAWLKRWLLETELRRIVSRIQPGTFLDVGCGIGDFAAMAHQRGFPVVTVDADAKRPLMTQTIANISHHQLDFEQYAISGLPSDRPYTAIIRHVLEHVKDPRVFLQRLRDYGASAFYLVVPNAACLERRVLGRYWNLWDPPRHLWHFTTRSLKTLVESQAMSMVAHGYDTIPNVIPSLYRLLRVHRAPRWAYAPLEPKGALSSVSAPLNLVLPNNVIWMLVRANHHIA